MSYIKSYKKFHKIDELTSTSNYENKIFKNGKLIDYAAISKDTAIKIQDLLDAERNTRIYTDPTRELIEKPIGLNENSKKNKK